MSAPSNQDRTVPFYACEHGVPGGCPKDAPNRIIGTPKLGHAIDKWKACGLTPAQTRTELERFAADMERDRANLVEALREARDFVSDSQGPNGKTSIQLFREWAALLRELGEAS